VAVVDDISCVTRVGDFESNTRENTLAREFHAWVLSTKANGA